MEAHANASPSWTSVPTPRPHDRGGGDAGDLGTHRGQIEFWERINVNPNVALPIIFAIGIGLWIRGTLLIRKERMEGGG